MSNVTNPCVPPRDSNWAGRLRSATAAARHLLLLLTLRSGNVEMWKCGNVSLPESIPAALVAERGRSRCPQHGDEDTLLSLVTNSSWGKGGHGTAGAGTSQGVHSLLGWGHVDPSPCVLLLRFFCGILSVWGRQSRATEGGEWGISACCSPAAPSPAFPPPFPAQWGLWNIYPNFFQVVLGV